MATANHPVRYHEDDNYEIELNRVREKIRAQFEDLTDRLKCRERELLEELDAILAFYRSYRDEVEIVRDKVRDLETIKQRNEEELATSRSKRLQENIIQQIEEEIKSQTYPKEPQLVSFVCESNVIFSEIDKLGKLVKKVTDSAESMNMTRRPLCDELNKRPSTPPNSSLSIWKSFENTFSSFPKKPDHTSPHSSSKRLSQTINSPSYKLDNILADTTVNYLSSYLSRTDINSSKNPKTSNSFHFTDFVDTGVYHEFSTFSRHGFNLGGKYWRSVQHYYQAQKYPSTEWLVTDIRTALTSKLANEIGKDKVYGKNIVKNWDSIREGVMLKALKAKFRKYYNLKDTLLATGDRQIVNDSENEFTGCGKDGKGKNTLGMLLMIVRRECLNTVVSTKPSSQPNHTNTSYSHPSPPLNAALNNDVIEFFARDKPYFEFSPYSRHKVYLDDISWKTLNHYFQAQKFTSNNEKRQIADAPTPERATYLANIDLKKFSKFQTFNEKEVIMNKGLEAKFTQHADLSRMLLDTGTKKLLFIHPEDLFWGTGIITSLGQNKLGVLLTELRLKLRIPTASSDPIYNPVNIQHTDSHPYSSSDDDTTQQRIVRGHASYTNKRYSFPPKQGNT